MAVPDLKNLELRGRIWWAHRRVPGSLRSVVGKHTLRRSLGTRDLAEAQRLRPLAIAEFSRMLEEARKTASNGHDPIAHRVAEWQSFAAAALKPTGTPASAADRAMLFAVEHTRIALDHGHDAGRTFVAKVTSGAHRALDLFIDDFHAEAIVKPKTKADQRMALTRLVAWDKTLTLETMTREKAGLYATKGLTHTTSAATKNKHIACLRAYWAWLVRRGKVDQNPWTGQSFSTAKPNLQTSDTLKERPFTDSEITALLSASAPARLRDGMMILALSGMRRDELCLLRVRDCDNGWFSIRVGKTASSVRRVPIHSGLKPIVIARITGRRPDDFLIHELGPERPKDSLRGRGAPLTQEFTRFRRTVGVDDQPEGNRRSLVNLHSFRRWFITAAERAGQPPWIIETVVGHKRTGMTLGVYSAGASEKQLRACIEAVKLPRGTSK